MNEQGLAQWNKHYGIHMDIPLEHIHEIQLAPPEILDLWMSIMMYAWAQSSN